jgi:hypothetical protein
MTKRDDISRYLRLTCSRWQGDIPALLQSTVWGQPNISVVAVDCHQLRGSGGQGTAQSLAWTGDRKREASSIAADGFDIPPSEQPGAIASERTANILCAVAPHRRLISVNCALRGAAHFEVETPKGRLHIRGGTTKTNIVKK